MGPDQPPSTPLARGQEPAHIGIHTVRSSLGLGEEEEARAREVGADILGEIPGWVDAFYSRLLTDKTAMMILADDARVIRLKRSLTSWFHELFTLPWDDEFERLRESIGNAHVHIQLSTHMMVTSMARIREDVRDSILVHFDDEPEEARENARVVSLALDMELALMLMAYRRRDRARARQKDRMVYARRAARRLAHTLYDRVDAALCYTELARTDDTRRREWLAKLRDVLRDLSRFDRRMQVQAKVDRIAPEMLRVSDLCARAVGQVSVGAGTRVEIEVEPPDLERELIGEAVVLAIEELVQNGTSHAPGGTTRVTARVGEDERLVLEVCDEGPGWAPHIATFKDIYTLGSGLGLSFCELVAELHAGTIDLFAAPEGGAGIRITLSTAEQPEEEQDA